MASTKADFSQRDPRWSGKLLGFAKWQTIGGYGCLVDSFANVAQAQGKDVDTGQMNEKLKTANLFVVDALGEKSDIMGPGALTQIYPDIKNIENRSWGSKLLTKDDFKFFDIRNSASDDVIVHIDYHPERSGMQDHYCRVIGVNDSLDDIEVVDSYTGKRIWLSSLGVPANRVIYSAYEYHGPGAGFVVNVPATPAVSLVSIRMNGDRTSKWNVRTSPAIDNNIRADGFCVGGQTYGAEIQSNGWAKINFNGKPGFIGPKSFTRQ